MKKLVAILMLLGVVSCSPHQDYVRADANTYMYVVEDTLYGIENNPENDADDKGIKRLVVRSWEFRIRQAGGFETEEK